MKQCVSVSVSVGVCVSEKEGQNRMRIVCISMFVRVCEFKSKCVGGFVPVHACAGACACEHPHPAVVCVVCE